MVLLTLIWSKLFSPAYSQRPPNFRRVIAEDLGEVVGHVVDDAAGAGRIGAAVEDVEVRDVDGGILLGRTLTAPS